MCFTGHADLYDIIRDFRNRRWFLLFCGQIVTSDMDHTYARFDSANVAFVWTYCLGIFSIELYPDDNLC